MKIVTFIILSLASLFFSKEMYAQEASLSVSPSVVTSIVQPDKSFIVNYTLVNNGDPQAVKVKVRSFVPKDISGGMEIKDQAEGSLRFTLQDSTITFDKPFFLKHKAEQSIPLRIRVPEGTPEKDYYYALIVETEPPPSPEGETHIKVKLSTVVPILITVSKDGSMEAKGKILLFTTIPRFKLSLFGETYNIIDSTDALPFRLLIRNNGKNVLKPEGNIKLQGSLGEKIEYQITPQNVLAQSDRMITIYSPQLYDCISNWCKKDVSGYIKGFFIGKYSLLSSVQFGEGASFVYSSTSFIAFPFKFLLIGSIVLFIVVILVDKIRSR